VALLSKLLEILLGKLHQGLIFHPTNATTFIGVSPQAGLKLNEVMKSQFTTTLNESNPKVIKKNKSRLTTIQPRCGGEALGLATPPNPIGLWCARVLLPPSAGDHNHNNSGTPLQARILLPPSTSDHNHNNSGILLCKDLTTTFSW
jgi:hypothetical protein